MSTFQNHPVLDMPEDERDNELRELLGIDESMPIPSEVIDMLEDLAGRQQDIGQINRELGGIADRMHTAGVPYNENAPAHLLRDQQVGQYGLETIQEMSPAQGFWAGDVPDQWAISGARIGLGATHTIDHLAQTWEWLQDQKVGGTAGGIKIAMNHILDSDGTLVEGLTIDAEANERYYEGIIARRERHMMGKVAW